MFLLKKGGFMQKPQPVKISEWDKNVLNLGICRLILVENDEEVTCQIKFLPGLGLVWRKDETTDHKMKAMHDFFVELQKICALLQKIGKKYEESNILIVPHSFMKNIPSMEDLNKSNLTYLKNKTKSNK